MKRKFSTKWKASKKPRKQRKYRANAPIHLRKKFLSVHLSKPLREKHKKRSIPIRKEDKVKIVRGQFRKKTGVITNVDRKKIKVYVDLAFRPKKDGTKAFYPIHPSNLIITELNLSDKKRKAKLGVKK